MSYELRNTTVQNLEQTSFLHECVCVCVFVCACVCA